MGRFLEILFEYTTLGRGNLLDIPFLNFGFLSVLA